MSLIPPLNALRCFEAAARLKSFSKAAEELHVTQSAVSHQIKVLEDWFAAKLFVRHGRETMPTPRGLDLAESLGSAFRMIAESCKRAEHSDGDLGLTIAVLPSIATIWLIPRLQDFSIQYPKIPLRVIYAFHGRTNSSHDFDVAINWGPDLKKGKNAVAFLPGATVAVANPALIARMPSLTTSHILQEYPLLHDLDRSGWVKYLAEVGLGNSAANSGPIFEDFNLLRAAALAGHGLALCPRSLIADDVLAGRLTIIFPEHVILQEYWYWLVEQDNPHRHNQTSINAFKTWLMHVATKETSLLERNP